jgi:hypothetical protein
MYSAKMLLIAVFYVIVISWKINYVAWNVFLSGFCFVLVWYWYCWVLRYQPIPIQSQLLVLYFNTIQYVLFICGAHVCRITFKHLPQPIRSHIKSFGIIGQLLKFSKKKLKMPPQGARGGLRIFLGVNISFFWENKPSVKFRNSNWTPSIFSKKP